MSTEEEKRMKHALHEALHHFLLVRSMLIPLIRSVFPRTDKVVLVSPQPIFPFSNRSRILWWTSSSVFFMCCWLKRKNERRAFVFLFSLFFLKRRPTILTGAKLNAKKKRKTDKASLSFACLKQTKKKLKIKKKKCIYARTWAFLVCVRISACTNARTITYLSRCLFLPALPILFFSFFKTWKSSRNAVTAGHGGFLSQKGLFTFARWHR